jgi:hypothetical protein
MLGERFPGQIAGALLLTARNKRIKGHRAFFHDAKRIDVDL